MSSVQRVGPALGEPLDPKSGHSSLRRPCLQRGEAWENATIVGQPTVVPENLRNKRRFEPAMPTYPMSKQVRLDTSLAGLENSKHITSFVSTKFREKNDDAGRNFALIGGRCGGGYESNTQQSTKQTFSYISWARVPAILGGLGDCGSHGITSHPRPFFACSNAG